MSTTQSIDFQKIKLKTKITVKHLRRLKEEGGIDFTSQDTGPMLTFAVDPDFVVMACYQLYLDQFEKAKLTEDDFAELCGAEEIEQLRGEVTQQMRSFSSFWKILSTAMEDLQSGDTNLLELGAKMQNLAEASGPSS